MINIALDISSSAMLSALLNGVWPGVLLAAGLCFLVWVIPQKYAINATTRFSIWVTGLLLCTGFIFWQLTAATNPTTTNPVTTNLITANPAPPSWQSSDPATQTPVSDTPIQAAPVPETPILETPISESPVLESPFLENQPQNQFTIFLSTQWQFVLLMVWLSLSGLLLIRLVVALVHVKKIKAGSYDAPAYVQQQLVQIHANLRRPRKANVAISDDISMAMAAGFFKPSILIPSYMLNSLSSAELEQVLIHETAHLQRYDDWILLLQKVVSAFFFFHPGVWLLSRLMDRDRELASDDWVVSLTQRPHEYASCLAKLVTKHPKPAMPAFSPTFSSGKKELFTRVKQILDKKRRVSFKVSRRLYVTVLLLGFLGISVLIIQSPLAVITASAKPTLSTTEEVISPRPTSSAPEPAEVPTSSKNNKEIEQPGLEKKGHEQPEQQAANSASVTQSVNALAATPIEPLKTRKIDVAIFDVAPFDIATSLEASTPLPTPRPNTRNTNSDISDKALAKVMLSAAGRLSGSDLELVLKEAVNTRDFTPDLHQSFFKAVAAIRSDSGQNRVLSGFLNTQELSKSATHLFLQAVSNIRSSHTRGDVTLRLLNSKNPHLQDGDIRNAVNSIIQTLSSNHQKKTQQIMATDYPR